MHKLKKPDDLLAIGQVAERTGLAVSAIRFYDDTGLISSERNAAGHRRFRRSSLRRVSFILIAQRLGYSLDDIRTQLDALPAGAAPSDADWEKLAVQFGAELDDRIARLSLLREKLAGCIGCGCLSLERCRLYNADDEVAVQGPGPRHVLRD